MISKIRDLLRSREVDDRAQLLRTARTLAAGGRAADKVDAAEVDALLRRLGRTPDDLERIADLERERAVATTDAAWFDDRLAAANNAMATLKAAKERREESLRKHDGEVAAAERDLAQAEQAMRAAAQARGRLRDLDSKVRLALGVDPEVDRRIVRLPGDLEASRESEGLLRRHLAQARARLARAELVLARDPNAGEFATNAVSGARTEVEQVEAELAALPARIEALETELHELQQGAL